MLTCCLYQNLIILIPLLKYFPFRCWYWYGYIATVTLANFHFPCNYLWCLDTFLVMPTHLSVKSDYLPALARLSSTHFCCDFLTPLFAFLSEEVSLLLTWQSVQFFIPTIFLLPLHSQRWVFKQKLENSWDLSRSDFPLGKDGICTYISPPPKQVFIFFQVQEKTVSLYNLPFSSIRFFPLLRGK